MTFTFIPLFASARQACPNVNAAGIAQKVSLKILVSRFITFCRAGSTVSSKLRFRPTYILLAGSLAGLMSLPRAAFAVKHRLALWLVVFG